MHFPQFKLTAKPLFLGCMKHLILDKFFKTILSLYLDMTARNLATIFFWPLFLCGSTLWVVPVQKLLSRYSIRHVQNYQLLEIIDVLYREATSVSVVTHFIANHNLNKFLLITQWFYLRVMLAFAQYTIIKGLISKYMSS